MSMKKIMNLVLAAILICGTTTFISCTNEDFFAIFLMVS